LVLAPKKKKAKLARSSSSNVGSKSPSASTQDDRKSATVSEAKPETAASNGKRKSIIGARRNVNGTTEVWSGTPDDDLEGGWPDGWTKKQFERTGGRTAGSIDSYWYSPIKKKKFRSMKEVRRFQMALEKYEGDEEKAWKVFKG